MTAAKTRPAKQPPLVLLVDDFDDSREMYAEYLKFSGYRTQEARNGQEALNCARTFMPDVILMDLSMPLLDGWEATRRLKADPQTKHIPIMALTGHALDGQAERAKGAGCDIFITKPCLPADLLAAIRSLMDRPGPGSADAPRKRSSRS
jgi:CheY-like chemotaxis protein